MKRRHRSARAQASVRACAWQSASMIASLGCLAVACATAESDRTPNHVSPDASVSGAGGTIVATGGQGSGAAPTSGGSDGVAGGAGHSSAGGVGGTACPSAAAGAGGAAGSPAFFDGFEDGNAAGWIRSPNTPGDWMIVCDGGLVYRQSTLAPELHVSAVGGSSWTDQIVQARVKVLEFGGGAASDSVGVYARFKDLSNHYYVALRNDGRVAIRLTVGGASTTLPGTAVSAGIVAGTWYTIKLSAIGSSLSAYVDGARVASATDTSIAEGSVAVGATDCTAEFDDVRVTLP